MMRLGVTGSQHGITHQQLERLTHIMRDDGVTTVHHGDCVGADAIAHGLATGLGLRTVVHPPDDPKKRAWCVGTEVLAEKPYLQRNQVIVDCTDLLVALPRQNAEPSHKRAGGTWHTIRYARRQRRKRIILWPDGRVEVER